MDWFERLTGFREAGYDETRAKLAVDGDRLRSLVNGKSYGIGQLELASLADLRSRVWSGKIVSAPTKVSPIIGDVRLMHRKPENAGALFQVASQFNLLEMVSPSVTPEHGVTRYEHDHTQGPACAIAPPGRRHCLLCRQPRSRRSDRTLLGRWSSSSGQN